MRCLPPFSSKPLYQNVRVFSNRKRRLRFGQSLNKDIFQSKRVQISNGDELNKFIEDQPYRSIHQTLNQISLLAITRYSFINPTQTILAPLYQKGLESIKSDFNARLMTFGKEAMVFYIEDDPHHVFKLSHKGILRDLDPEFDLPRFDETHIDIDPLLDDEDRFFIGQHNIQLEPFIHHYKQPIVSTLEAFRDKGISINGKDPLSLAEGFMVKVINSGKYKIKSGEYQLMQLGVYGDKIRLIDPHVLENL